MGFLLSWLPKPITDPEIDDAVWFDFLSEMGWWLFGWAIITIVVIGVIYYLALRGKKIRQPSDLFSSFTPMYWLWLSVLPGIIMAMQFYSKGRGCLGKHAPLFGRSIGTGLELTILSALLTWLVIAIFTPFKFPQFAYRPVGFFCRLFRFGVKKSTI
jgi:hypothetical protein